MKHYLFTAVFFLLLSSAFAQSKDVVGANVDATVKPGDDFFKYANGGWIKKNPIPAAYSQWGIGNLVQEDVWDKLYAVNRSAFKKVEMGNADLSTKQIAGFFQSAMDTATINK
ncbi:MAG TPA: M13 family metallopeptidase N-terminal domain-containing protein, partial [Chitinophagales bacterium]|nr:M13 family metallopeptidase N-terminal domain-containing protein [Chitinophagales bacterium]